MGFLLSSAVPGEIDDRDRFCERICNVRGAKKNADWLRKKRRPIGVLSFTPSKIFSFGRGREKEVCVCADFLAHDSGEERKGGKSMKFWIQHGISHTFHFAAQIGKYAPSNALESALTSAQEGERVYIYPTVYFRKCLYSMKKRREITACRRTLLQKKYRPAPPPPFARRSLLLLSSHAGAGAVVASVEYESVAKERGYQTHQKVCFSSLFPSQGLYRQVNTW